MEPGTFLTAIKLQKCFYLCVYNLQGSGMQVTPEFLCRYWEFELRPSCLCEKSPTERGEDIIEARKLGIKFSGLKHREPF